MAAPPLPPTKGLSAGAVPAFWICAAYTFLIVSRSVEFIDNTGRLHLSLISGVMCVVALLLTGNIPKLLVTRPGQWISLLCLWIFIGLPFSTWKGGSAGFFQSVWLKSYLTFFIVGGLIFTLKQMRAMSFVLALGTMSQILIAYRSGGSQEEDRMSATYGSLGNANDLASALLIGAPFLVLTMNNRNVNPVFRMLCLPALCVLLVVTLKTGSRGGLIALATMLAVSFFRASPGQKILLFVAGICVLALFATVVPSSLRSRYMTIFQTDRKEVTTQGAESALDSSNARRGLIENAARLTLRHPVFGVGLGQFSPQSFNLFVERGITGMWFTCHDIFGLVASETGVPGLFFFCMTIYSTFSLLSRLSKVGTSTPERESIALLAQAIFMSTLAYFVCGIFNTQAYSFQLPTLAGLAVALSRVAAPHLAIPEQSRTSSYMPQPFVNRRLARTAGATS